MTSKPFAFTGRPMNSAPAYLLPWLDTVDGAIAIGGIIGPEGMTHASWELCRGGEPVARITVDVKTGELV